MPSNLQHLPEKKQAELLALTQVLKTIRGIEMVILFGSYARGTWVEDLYTEKGTIYEYRSDYDILIVTKEDNPIKNHRIECKVDKSIPEEVATPLSFIYHSIKFLNQALSIGNYFFNDIAKEGIVLYTSERFTLEEPKDLSPTEAQQKAQDYYKQWFTSANDFFKHYQYAMNDKSYNNAAFMLHQATERFYTTILLVYTDYRPKEHDLARLEKQAINCNSRFNVFPKTTKTERDLFTLLKKAYIDSRYKMDEYQITQQDLAYLAEKVEHLKGLTEEICKAKIVEIGGY